jgi:hypothetical protein
MAISHLLVSVSKLHLSASEDLSLPLSWLSPL